MASEPKTLQEAIKFFADPDNCLNYLVVRRWPTGVICPICGSRDVGFTATRRVWECKEKPRHARRQFSVKVGTSLYSDALKSYQGLEKDFSHQVIDHAEAYVNGQVHTNGCENFWSLLKRGINGTYVSVEPFHLFRYLDEQAFRYNNREDMDDFDRFKLAMSQIVGKRLTWDNLTGKQPDYATPVN